jgi:hypothetical protein
LQWSHKRYTPGRSSSISACRSAAACCDASIT